jgi:hypothetical protein
LKGPVLIPMPHDWTHAGNIAHSISQHKSLVAFLAKDSELSLLLELTFLQFHFLIRFGTPVFIFALAERAELCKCSSVCLWANSRSENAGKHVAVCVCRHILEAKTRASAIR